MPIPDLCILEWAITGYSWNGCHYNVVMQLTSSTMLSWAYSEYKWWTPRAELTKGKGKKPSRDTYLVALQKNTDAITLLQQSSLLTSAVLSNYASLKSLVVAAFVLSFKAMTLSTRCSYYIPVTLYNLIEAAYICSGDRSDIGIRPDPHAVCLSLALSD